MKLDVMNIANSETPAQAQELAQSLEMNIRASHQGASKTLAEAIIEGQAIGSKLANAANVAMLAGQVQMAKAIENFTTVGSLKILQKAKESKSYRNLKGIELPTGEILTGTWADFCKLIGESTSTIDERLKNLDTFGAKALESMQAIGMGIRDLRRLRQLPPDELLTLVDGDQLKVKDREEALIIIEEMAAKHRTESNELKEKIESLEQSSKATDQLLEKKGKQIQELEKELELAKCANSPAKVKQLEAERNKVLSSAVIAAKFEIFKGLAAFEDAVIAIQAVDHPCDMDDEYLSGMREIVSRMMEGSARAGLDQVVVDTLKAELVMYSGALN